MAPSSTDGDSFNAPGSDGKSQSQDLSVDDQLRSSTRRRPQTNECQQADERHYQLTGTTCSDEPSFSSEGTPRWLPDPLSLYSSELQAIRRGGFEALTPGEDARRGAPVLNTATKSAIANGIMSNHFSWFHRVVETAKRKKGSTSTASSLVNARDEDGMPLLALAIHLGCSTAIVSYLMRNGAVVDDETIKLAAYLGQKNSLSRVLQEHMFVDGVVNSEACSHAIVDTIENARKRQKDQELCLRLEGEEFLLKAVRELIQFGIEYIASSEALLFSIPGDTLACRLFKACQDISDCPLTNYLRLVEGLLWTKEVEDIALGLSLTSILLKVASLKDVAVTLHRFGVSDLIAFHQHQSSKRLEALRDINKSLTSDARRFSPHHVAAREPEVNALVSSGVVLCPKCHPAELHLTRHSSFRCDLCGNGVDRGFPMHGCRECDWDACEDCIDVREGGIVKWKYVQLISRECALAIDFQKCDNIDSSKAQLSAKDWSLQTTSARIKALDVDVLQDLAAQLASAGALTMFEFSNHILPVLVEALCGDSSVVSTPPVSQYDPPMKKRKPQFRTNSSNRPCFIDKFITTLIVQPVVKRFEVEVSDNERKQGDQFVPRGDRNVDPNAATEGEIPTRIKQHTPEILRRLHVLLSFFEKLPRSKVILTGTKETSDDLRSLTKPWTIEVIQYDQPFVVNCEPLMQLSCLKDHLLRSAACRDASFVSYCQRLAEDKAIIAESRNRLTGSSFGDSEDFRLGQVIDFDPEIGVHRIKYATKNLGEVGASNLRELDPDNQNLSEYFEFDSSEECVLVGCKTFMVLQRFKNAERDDYKFIVESVLKSRRPSDVVPVSFPPSALPRGTRVEKGSKAYTIIGCSPASSSSRHAFEYDLVSDSGEVIRAIPHHDLKCGLASESRSSRVRSLSERVAASSRDRSFRMIALRSLASGDEDTGHSQASEIGVLKRSWSALSTRPVVSD
ncbi:negative regulation of histone ubiquitination [Fragilaria crotonensis]|nr:negative regulation of histone ubiquitination [Fragilaria crotonensis]